MGSKPEHAKIPDMSWAEWETERNYISALCYTCYSKDFKKTRKCKDCLGTENDVLPWFELGVKSK